ncbi:processivity factor [Bovine gammaherpesvirus 6]|uniref:Processivity factor n=1 Tax=Bovine gammaherpesvirus 6 TaxID=1504288 RepID=A0A060D343_9GAMA|nr:processivity factor [Bovine gammaherpesvirus 6]AIB03214.1 processivity factor [Bovine gammaherpesvirus 6]
METSAVFTFKPEAFKGAFKLHDHIKAHLKKAIVQITDLNSSPLLSFICKVGDAGIINFQLLEAVEAVNIQCDPSEPLSFRNQSFGSTYVHSRELFGTDIEEMTVTFYKRESFPEKRPEFVETKICYQNNVTETRHTSTTEAHVLPVEKQLQKSVVNAKIIFSIKTCTMLQKWLRQQKSESKTVRVHVNETLSVLVMTVGNQSKTIEFKNYAVEPSDAFQTLDRPGNVGAVLSDCSCVISLESLIQAIGICKVPGVCVPAFKFYSGNILEVAGAHLKQNKNSSSSVSVVLLNAPDLTDKEEPSASSAPVPATVSQAARSQLSDSEEDSHLPDSPTLTTINEECIRREAITPIKRKHSDHKSSKKFKKAKLSFTPLI